MNNKIKNYIEDIKHLENIFLTVVKDNYNNKTLSPKDINLLQKVHFECTGSTEYRNLTCANCIYRLIFFVGKMYIEYMENVKSIKPINNGKQVSGSSPKGGNKKPKRQGQRSTKQK